MTDDWHKIRDEILADPDVREEYERVRPKYELASRSIEAGSNRRLRRVECGREGASGREEEDA